MQLFALNLKIVVLSKLLYADKLGFGNPDLGAGKLIEILRDRHQATYSLAPVFPVL